MPSQLLCCVVLMPVRSSKTNDALLVYHIQAAELDGLEPTVTLAPPVVDAVSTVIRLQEY